MCWISGKLSKHEIVVCLIDGISTQVIIFYEYMDLATFRIELLIVSSVRNVRVILDKSYEERP